MQVSSRQRQHHIYVAEMFRHHARVLKGAIDTPEFEIRFMYAKGNVANDLFRSTVEIKTGLITNKACDLLTKSTKCNPYKPTKEHVMSRNRSAEHILNRLLKYETSDTRLLNMIITSCRTALTTKSENGQLEQERKKIQETTGRCITPWRKLYSELGFSLSSKTQSTRTTLSIIVDGQSYTSAKAVAEHFSITSTEVYRRCRSTSKKWKQWKSDK